MSDICSSLVLIIHILEIDTSDFKKTNGVEGKLVKALKNVIGNGLQTLGANLKESM